MVGVIGVPARAMFDALAGLVLVTVGDLTHQRAIGQRVLCEVLRHRLAKVADRRQILLRGEFLIPDHQRHMLDHGRIERLACCIVERLAQVDAGDLSADVF